MIFDDRRDAAEKLAAQLEQYRGMHAAVLAIPRGAIEMGSAIARHLDAELDVALVRKLRCPWDEEFAIGAVDESGWSYIAPHAEPLAISAQYIESERQEQLAVLKARRARYTPGRGPLDLAGRIAIVVDDGLATGSTMRAALHAVRARNPAKLVCAVPVASTSI